MIKIIQATNRQKLAPYFHDMHKNRADVFHKRLGWDVTVVDDLEMDHFDTINPLYIIAISDNDGSYLGSVRMLPEF